MRWEPVCTTPSWRSSRRTRTTTSRTVPVASASSYWVIVTTSWWSRRPPERRRVGGKDAPGSEVEQMPGHPLPDGRKGTARELPEEGEDPFTGLGQERVGHPDVSQGELADDPRPEPDDHRVRERLDGERPRRLGEQGRDADECPGAAVAHRHHPPVRRRHPGQDEARRHELEVR